MIKLPTSTYREVKKFDWFAWLMAIFGTVLMVLISTNPDASWGPRVFGCIVTLWFLSDWFVRLLKGKLYSHVYYDTILHTVYHVSIPLLEEDYYIAAQNEDELALYLETHYPMVADNYEILEEIKVETFEKTEKFL